MKCKWKHCKNEAKDKNPKGFCSRSCKDKYYVDLRRKKLKILAIEYKGGKCSVCGYSNCSRALEFHHRDPNGKDFGVSRSGHTMSLTRLKVELDKCDMLCANCHRELHS
jgi:hypothetical protein